MNAQEIIEITQRLPYDAHKEAMEIAMEFRKKKLVYIPFGSDDLFLHFLEMITAIWNGGYIAGVQAERKKRRSH